jgi:hypothetical protein
MENNENDLQIDDELNKYIQQQFADFNAEFNDPNISYRAVRVAIKQQKAQFDKVMGSQENPQFKELKKVTEQFWTKLHDRIEQIISLLD